MEEEVGAGQDGKGAEQDGKRVGQDEESHHVVDEVVKL